MKAAAVLDVPELLTTTEVAALLKLNRSTVSRWRSVGAGHETCIVDAPFGRVPAEHVQVEIACRRPVTRERMAVLCRGSND
jgi:hypothetical protein